LPEGVYLQLVRALISYIHLGQSLLWHCRSRPTRIPIASEPAHMTISIRFGLSLLILCGVALPLRGDQRHTSPHQLLPQALTLARAIPDGKGYGDWRKPLVFLRIGSTMRLCGMKAEAKAALDECAVLNSRSRLPAVRDEIAVELCRGFTLLARPEKARSLANKITFRNYATIARYVIARTILETGNLAEAEQSVMNAPALTRSPETKTIRTDDLWTRAFVSVAVRMNKLDLARRLIGTMRYEPWKSAAIGDVSEALARSGEAEETLRTAAGVPDAYMAVLAFARVAAVFCEQDASEPLARAVASLQRAASKVTDDTARDFALRIAVKKLSAAGGTDTAAEIAEDIKAPCSRVLANCVLLTPETLDSVLKQLGRCPEGERPLLVEAVTISCGSKGMAPGALKAAEHVEPGWKRFRALWTAAYRLACAGAKSDAADLLAAAAETANDIKEAGRRCCALIRMALLYHRLGSCDAVEKNLVAAHKEAARLAQPELAASVLPQVVEAAAVTGERNLVKSMVLDAIKAESSSTLRNRLVPMLALAENHEAALAECSREQLSEDFARRVLVYRLARSGQVAGALEYAERLKTSERAEAFSDIALAQIQRPTPDPCARKMVGVSLHGSWGSWFPRLERMGLAWELMPFSMPYETGTKGLKAKYSMLAYPGTGGHMAHVSVAGAEHMREYLYSGGGLFGICAGQFLATRRDFTPCDSIYMRGQGPHQVQMRKNHLVALDLPPVVVIPRRNGGILIPRPGCEVVGWYDKIDRYAALVAARYGFGRVVAFSPHPEGSSDFVPRDRLCIHATNWTIGGLP